MVERAASQNSGPVLQVENLWVRKGGMRGYKWIVKGVSFDVKPGEFVAVIGPNGAGKTKMLEAITGDRPYAGRVLMRDQDLFANPDYWLRRIGWVPSYNVLHDNLQVRQALLQIGRLRLPGRPVKSIQNRIEALLDELEFPEDRRNAQVRHLSSGQRKRLDLCAELLTNPPLLLLDEPTTNLDPDAERSLMALLSHRAHDEGQAVLIVTHTLQSLYYCDRVIFLANGRLRAMGSNEKVLTELEADLDVEDKIVDFIVPENGAPVDDPLTEMPVDLDDAARWAAIYRASKVYDEEPLGDTPAKAPPPPQSRYKIKPRDWVHELRVLLRRNWLQFTNNPAALGIYLLLGPFSGFLSRIVLRDNAFIQNEDLSGYSSVFDTSDARQAIFIIALVVSLLGLIASFLDVTRERPIYRYERVKGLSPWSYILSKWVMLSVLVGILAPTLLIFVLTFQGQDLPFTGLVLVTLFLACIASVTLGLAISAASTSERTATGLLGIIVVFNLFFSGGVDFNERFQTLLERISVFAPSHWAAKGITLSIELYCWAANPRFQDFASIGHLVSVWLYLVVYVLIALAVAFIALRLQDIWFARKDRIIKALFNEHMLMLAPLVLVAWSWALYLEQRSQDYYVLRAAEDTVRIENSYYFDELRLFQKVNGYVSQSRCMLPTPLPPMPTAMVAIPPTPVNTAISPAVETPQAALETPAPDLQPAITSDPSLPPLPVGEMVSEADLLFSPANPDLPLARLPAGARVVLLGKNQSEDWYRIQEQHTGRNLVGWTQRIATNLPPSQTGLVGSPPACAAPRIYLENNGNAPSVSWNSDVAGHVVSVLDIFRDQAGVETRPGQLLVEVNGEIVNSYPINPTRQAFIFRGLAVDTTLSTDEVLRFYIETPLSDEILYLRASVFFVPYGCSFLEGIGNDG